MIQSTTKVGQDLSGNCAYAKLGRKLMVSSMQLATGTTLIQLALHTTVTLHSVDTTCTLRDQHQHPVPLSTCV